MSDSFQTSYISLVPIDISEAFHWWIDRCIDGFMDGSMDRSKHWWNHPSIHRLINPSTNQLIHWSIDQYIDRSIGQSIDPSIHRSFDLSIHRSIHPSIHPPIIQLIYPLIDLSIDSSINTLIQLIHPSIGSPLCNFNCQQINSLILFLYTIAYISLQCLCFYFKLY